jgi:hypothetical protein
MKGAVSFAALIAALATAGSAGASEIIGRNATNVRLSVTSNGQALVSYSAQGRAYRVRAWGAVNARHPSPTRPQIRFRMDYSGRSWTAFKGTCQPYTGPELAFQVAACAGPDGTYWALQAWRRTLPNFDARPRRGLGMMELHLSHWSGPTAQLEAWADWVYGGRHHHIFGRLTYNGHPVHGYTATRVGNPMDTYGRNIYVDTFNSRYGKGWKRENAFLAHRPSGGFCYGFYPFTKRGPGNGEKYRLTVIGPGVTPLVSITIPGLHNYDRNNPSDVAFERERNALQDSVTAGGKRCAH